MASNGDLDHGTLRALPGFLPYAAGSNFRAVTEADGSNLILASMYTDAVNMATDFERDCHQPLTYAESYRSIRVQRVRAVEHTHGGPNAATPGYSNHGWAQAIDYRNGIGGGPGNTTYDWMRAHAASYGFVEDVPGEHWHWHHPSRTSVTRPRTTTTASLTAETIHIGDPDMYVLKNTSRGWFTLVGREYVRHLAETDAVFLAKVVSESDEVHELSDNQVATVFAALNIPIGYRDPNAPKVRKTRVWSK